MSIKAIGFDTGGTLVNYNKPLNWSASYYDALKFMCLENNIEFSDERFGTAKKVLEKYNTRINPRQVEVKSDIIFGEIFEKWNENEQKLYEAKKSFYTFFQRESNLYDDAKQLLEYCKKNNIKCAVYTDVAYGMDDEFSLKDIEDFEEYIELKLTSENVGYRKPNIKGFERMLKEFKCRPNEMMYVGDEEKDILGSKAAGMYAILINRENVDKNFKQDYTVRNLIQIIDLIKDEKNKLNSRKDDELQINI